MYITEQIVIENEPFHKTCLRCKECDKVLSLGNYAVRSFRRPHSAALDCVSLFVVSSVQAMGGVFYCKPHFKQLFKEKGNYDEVRKHTSAQRRV